MATTQQYSLRWNNYLRHLTYSLDNHRLNDDFVDVSLCVDGRKIKAHKVVLSSCSSYFKEIFKENPHPHPVIIFKFIKFEDLNSIVEFMYQGEVNVQQEALQSFLQTAELLAVQGLTAEEKEKPQLPVAPLINDDDNMYTTETVDYAVKDEQTIVKSTEMTFLRGTVKMDIPDYIVSEVDDRLSDGATPQTSQDASNAAGQTVAQYSSEYEILTESEIEEKYQADADNSEIAIEMTRLLSTATTSSSTGNSQTVLEDANDATTGTTTTVSVTPVKTDNKASGTTAATAAGAGAEVEVLQTSLEDPNAAQCALNLTCNFCKRRLQSMNALRRHIASRHTDIQSKEYECFICMRNFKTKWSLSTHNSRFHRDVRLTKDLTKLDMAEHDLN
ncbi:CG12236 [Drosophila busckii]|uniref:CG12236 n=1 Tax=Drosophila busckii TaxID=30019 RepID=A0A0M4ENC7_DROBS|nr:CG12236 [Drosophila busckii]